MSSNLTKPRLAATLLVALTVLMGVACSGESSGESVKTGKPAAGNSKWPPEGKLEQLAPNLTTRNFYVIFDGSGSMNDTACGGGGRKIDQAKAALQTFAEAVPRNANLGLLVFDQHGVSERVSLGSDNRDAFIKQVFAVSPSASTPLKTAVSVGRAKLEAQAQSQLGYGEYNLVVVTDGEASPGEDPRNAVNAMLAETPILLHTIGFCISESHSLNQPGRTVYKSASDGAGIKSGLGDVLAESPNFTTQKFGGKN